MMLTGKEAAALLGITHEAWRYRIAKKTLGIPTYQIPGAGSRPVLRWKQADVERLRDNREN